MERCHNALTKRTITNMSETKGETLELFFKLGSFFRLSSFLCRIVQSQADTLMVSSPESESFLLS